MRSLQRTWSLQRDREHLFSDATDIYDEKLSRLLHEKAEILLFIKITTSFILSKL